MDLATRYLQALQLGYRIDEYNILTDGNTVPMVVCPYNPNRVLLYFYPIFTSSDDMFFKMQSGLLVKLYHYQETGYRIFTTAKHYSLPSLEVIVSNSFAGHEIKGFGIIKQ